MGKRKKETIRFSEAVQRLVILTKPEAAQLLGCTVRYIERAVNSGRLRACKPTGKFVRIYRNDIDAFLSSGATMETKP